LARLDVFDLASDFLHDADGDTLPSSLPIIAAGDRG